MKEELKNKKKQRKMHAIRWKNWIKNKIIWGENRYEKIERMQSEDILVLDEAPNAKISLDVDIQQENLQQKHAPKEYFSNKENERI